MNKVLVLFIFFGLVSFAQEQRKEVCKKGNLYEATYYHDNGIVAQHGFFNDSNKLQGVWISYDVNGNKTAIGKYENGQKTGIWLFFEKHKLTQVDYKEFKMIAVNEWQNKNAIVVKD